MVCAGWWLHGETAGLQLREMRERCAHMQRPEVLHAAMQEVPELLPRAACLDLPGVLLG
jgi:hypothetical protein